MTTPTSATAESVLPLASVPGPVPVPAPVGGAPLPPALNLATTPQKIWLCLILTLLSFTVLLCTYRAIGQVNDAALVEHATSWEMPAGVNLRAVPNFRYDPERKLLLRSGS